MKLKTLVAGMFMGALATTSLFADNAQGITANTTQIKEIEKVVHDYLIQHPEVLLEASQALQQKQQQEMQQQAKSAIMQNSNELIKETLAVAGNPKGSVTLVEFFDYQCGHCVKMKPIVNNLIKNDPNLRVVYREFPIFGKTSEMASRIALAAALQGKYVSVQDGLFGSSKNLDEASMMNAAKTAGVNMEKLKADMNSKVITEALAANRSLAEKLHLMGTPAFIVLSTPNGQVSASSEPTFVPGSTSEASLQDMIKKASGKS